MENAPKVSLCGHCNKRGVSKKCASCGQFYCDRVCQRKDWAAHKEGCGMIYKIRGFCSVLKMLEKSPQLNFFGEFKLFTTSLLMILYFIIYIVLSMRLVV